MEARRCNGFSGKLKFIRYMNLVGDECMEDGEILCRFTLLD